jgi:RND family efflux transporter MFP subunit
VQLSVPAYPNQTFGGTVKTISPTIDTRSRTAAVRIEPQDTGGKLRAGMFARLNIVTAQKQDALVVPKTAVLSATPGSALTQPMVLLIDPTGVIHRQPVQLGLQNDQQAEILSGLDDGQLVATSNVSDLADGDVVSPQIPQNSVTADVLQH